jgi:hypothetical protein
MIKVAKPLEDREAEFVDEDDSSVGETKKAPGTFTPTIKVSWPHGTAKPPEDPQTPLDTATGTRREGGRINRTLDNREEAEKAKADDHRHDREVGDSHRGSVEAKWAAGYTKVAGKHITNPGLLTSGGKAKILPETVDRRWMEAHADELERIANAILSPRDLVVFRARVIDPLMGRGKQDVNYLAKQLNVKTGWIYKSIDGSWQKVATAVQATAANDPGEQAFIDALRTKCGRCGRERLRQWNDVCPDRHCWFFEGGRR